MASQGTLFRVCRRVLRWRYGRYECGKVLNEPAVYICRHRNSTGPIISLCYLPLGIRPWVFDAFTTREACRKHCEEYTFPVTWHKSPSASRRLARLITPFFVALVNSAGAIPVFRKSLRIRETFSQSVKALENGESILIFPDVNYASETGKTGELYEGFLMLEQIWNRRTGGHIQFVPVGISTSRKKLSIGKSISFSGEKNFAAEKAAVAKEIERALDGLAEENGF